MRATKEFDFKPFFDLIVGMLFVMIIMVSAGLVFQKYNTSNEIDNTNTIAFEKQVFSFLSWVQINLNNKGFDPTLDVTHRRITIEASSFLKQPDHILILREIISELPNYPLLKLQNINIHVAVPDLAGQPANDVGEAIFNSSIYKKDAGLFNLRNEQAHALIKINKQTTLQKEGFLTFKFDLGMNNDLRQK